MWERSEPNYNQLKIIKYFLKIKLLYFDRENSDGVVCKDLLVSYGHLKRSKIFLPTLRPILLTLDLILPSLILVTMTMVGGRSCQIRCQKSTNVLGRGSVDHYLHVLLRVSSSDKNWGGSMINEWAYSAHQVPWDDSSFNSSSLFWIIFDQKQMLVILFGDLL